MHQPATDPVWSKEQPAVYPALNSAAPLLDRDRRLLLLSFSLASTCIRLLALAYPALTPLHPKNASTCSIRHGEQVPRVRRSSSSRRVGLNLDSAPRKFGRRTLLPHDASGVPPYHASPPTRERLKGRCPANRLPKPQETVATRTAFSAGVTGTRYTENPDPDFDIPVATDNVHRTRALQASSVYRSACGLTSVFSGVTTILPGRSRRLKMCAANMMSLK